MTYENLQIQRNIPWSQAWVDTVIFVRESKIVVVLFFSFEFMASLPSSPNLLDMDILDPLVTLELTSSSFIEWTSALVASALISTALLFWIAVSRQERASFSSVLRRANQLVWPLTFLGVRGTLLTVVGMIALFMPGLYFNFKYNLATLCLVLGTGLTANSAVMNAERILANYRFRLLPLAILPAIGWFAPWRISFGTPLVVRATNALTDATFTTLSTIYTALTIARILQTMAPDRGAKLVD